jgi:hypothetical protein
MSVRGVCPEAWRWPTPQRPVRRGQGAKRTFQRPFRAGVSPPPRAGVVDDGCRLARGAGVRVLVRARRLPGAGDTSRGFVSHIACAAEDWLAHADALAWHPGQTVECRECKGTTAVCIYDKGGRRVGGGMSTWNGRTRGGWPIEDCPKCRDADGIPTGRISRPCPETAQPLERVTLTTVPPVHGCWASGVISGSLRGEDHPNRRMVPAPSSRPLVDIALDLLGLEWPHVRFELPPARFPPASEGEGPGPADLPFDR